MRKVLKKVNHKIDKWLHKEEYEALEQQEEKMKEAVEKMKEDFQRLGEQIQIIENEDHSQAPTDDDIERYYEYHRTFVTNIKHMKEKTGMWVSKEKSLIPRVDFRIKAEEEGWSFLRESCGLPEGSIIGGSPWKSEGHGSGWTSDQSTAE